MVKNAVMSVSHDVQSVFKRGITVREDQIEQDLLRLKRS